LEEAVDDTVALVASGVKIQVFNLPLLSRILEHPPAC
jgi:hypothetical protein